MRKYDVKGYWNGLGKAIDVYVDGTAAVIYPTGPRYINNFVNHTQRKAFITLLNYCYGDFQYYNKTALDIGCGTGRWCKVLLKRGFKVVGIDISEGMIEKANWNLDAEGLLNDNIAFKLMNIEDSNFPDNHFDLVSSITVLQHNPYDSQKKIIKNICSATKCGGYILIIEHTKKHSGLDMFPRSKNEWIKLFEENGCICIATKGVLYVPLYKLLQRFLNTVFGHVIDKKRGMEIGHAYSSSKKMPFQEKMYYQYVLKVVIFFSYPLENLCFHLLPSRLADHSAILFQKKSAK